MCVCRAPPPLPLRPHPLFFRPSVCVQGKMANVLRVYNDEVGVELCARTGVNPSYTYVSVGCRASDTQAMLQFAKRQIAKPFSQVGMLRSIVYPRQSNGASWFCAELVAATLQVGGLMPPGHNPGGTTPAMLYSMFKQHGSVSANMYTLRNTSERLLQRQELKRLGIGSSSRSKQAYTKVSNGAELMDMAVTERRHMLTSFMQQQQGPRPASQSRGVENNKSPSTSSKFSFRL